MDAPLLKTPLPGPRAKALIERDARVVSTSYTRGYPFVMARGEGAIVEVTWSRAAFAAPEERAAETAS